MRLLVAPMLAMAESSGPRARALALAHAAVERKWEATLCVPDDGSLAISDGVTRRPALVPSPLGMPPALGRHTFPLAQRLGLNRHASIRCFDNVLRLTGNADRRYLEAAVSQMRALLQDGGFDAVYSEFNIAAIVAATAEGVPLFGSASLPTRPLFASNPRTGRGVNSVLRSFGLEPVDSPEDLLMWPRMRFVPSCHTLEPFPESDTVTYTGLFGALPTDTRGALSRERNAVVAYLGNGTVTPRRAVRALGAALKGGSLTAYVAGLPEGVYGNVRTAPSFDFSELLPRAVAFLNHGGQNSVMDGIAYRVPQIVCPGKVFERRFNAQSAERAGVGIVLEHGCFDAAHLHATFGELTKRGKAMRDAADALCEEMASLGGASGVLDAIEHSLAPFPSC